MPENHAVFEDRRATISRYDGRLNISLGYLGSILAILVALVSLTGAAYAAARTGVKAAVREEINRQVEAPTSPINRQMRATIAAHEEDICEPRWKEVQDRMTVIEIGTARVETKIDILIERAE